MPGSYQLAPPPLRLAEYIAMSDCRMSLSASSVSKLPTAMPMLAPI
jgi:hypothetical protein